MTSRLASCALLAVAALALTACAADPAEPSTPPATTAPASPSSTATTAQASPIPTETAAALDCPAWSDDPDGQVAAIGPNYFAGACLGRSFDDAAANGSPVTAGEPCPWYGTITADDELGYYGITVTPTETPGDGIFLFILRWFSEPADAAAYDLPATAEGITIGSSVKDVLAAYPAGTEVTFDDISRGVRTQIVVPTGADTSYNFDIADGVVTEIAWGNQIMDGGPNGELCAL